MKCKNKQINKDYCFDFPCRAIPCDIKQFHQNNRTAATQISLFILTLVVSIGNVPATKICNKYEKK